MRINRIVSQIDKCEVLMDVGCDHGKVSELVLKRSLCKRLIAVDISEKCLAKARKRLCGYDNVTFAVGDGIVSAEAEPDFIVIAGIGGHTIRDILAAYDGNATLLLSPQSHAELVREHILRRGYEITADSCFEDGGKFYDLIKAVYTGKPTASDERHLKYGRYEVPNDALQKRLARMLAKLPEGGEKYIEVQEVLKWQK